MTRLILLHLSTALMVLTIAARATDTERSLRDQYEGRIFMLRDCRPGQTLYYDSAAGVNPTDGGDWTTDGLVRVDEIHLAGNTLKIKGTRQIVVSAGRKGLQFAAEKMVRKTKNRGAVEIEVHFIEDGLTKANAIWSKVFLTSQENFVDLVPGYWKVCIADGLAGKNGSCRFSSEIGAVPGMAKQKQALVQTGEDDAYRDSSTAPDGIAANNLNAVTRVGSAVKPPQVIHSPEPPYSEPARKMGYHGAVTLRLVVNRDGVPEEVHIVNPLGAGLDVNAVRAVEKWRFQPAEKEGQPVAVRIAVEVDFRRY
jgi:TonB family protein